jgi:predicted nucleotidyltransferase
LLRTIPADFDRLQVAAIDARLDGICREHRVALPLAVESGSRAWGFPSPDSDYDCRFIFVRPTDQHLTPWPRRDVIETPLEDDLDVNGWELAKALRLLLKGNAVIVEWLMSPVIYRADPWFRTALTAFAAEHGSRVGTQRHYLHLGERQRRTYFGDGKSVQLKKLFYALRPAAALRWLRLHPGAQIAPMHFPTLLEQCDPPADIASLAAELIARKAVTRELGEARLPPVIDRFLEAEFDAARDMLPSEPVPLSPSAKAAAEALFREAVARFDPGGSTRGA